MASIFFLVLKYEIKSFSRYLQSKRYRIVGLIIGLIVFGLYMFGVFYILTNPLISQVFLEYKEFLLQSMISGVFLLCVMAIVGGFSILTTIRKNQRVKINLMLQSPHYPRSVISTFLIINAIIVDLYYTLIAYPAIFALLCALKISIFAIILFFISLTLAIISFAAIGCMFGILYVKLTGKQKRYLAMLLACIGAFAYSLIYFPGEHTIEVLRFSNWILNNTSSPFRWISASLFFEYGPIEYLLFVLGIVFSIALLEFSSRYLTNKYLAGVIKVPKEKIGIKHKHKYGIVDRMFGREVGAIFRKEIKMFTREPAMISGFLFAYVLFILAMLSFTQKHQGDKFIELVFIPMFLILMAIIPSIGMIPTALAMERKNMAILFSSPVKCEKIVKGKSLLGELLSMVSALIIIPFVFIIVKDVAMILFIIMLLVDIIIVVSALSMYIAVKYTDFKAENPRKALKTMGAIILIGVMMLLFSLIPPLIFYVIVTGASMRCLVISIILFIPALIIRRTFISRAGRFLENLEATEYL